MLKSCTSIGLHKNFLLADFIFFICWCFFSFCTSRNNKTDNVSRRREKIEWSAFFPKCFFLLLACFTLKYLEDYSSGIRLALARLLLNNLIIFYRRTLSSLFSFYCTLIPYHLLREIIHYHFQLFFFLRFLIRDFFVGLFAASAQFYIISVWFFVIHFTRTTITQHNDYSPTNFIA